LTEEKDIDSRWQIYFETLLNMSDNLTYAAENNINTESALKLDDSAISTEEVQKATSYMKNKSGVDGWTTC